MQLSTWKGPFTCARPCSAAPVPASAALQVREHSRTCPRPSVCVTSRKATSGRKRPRDEQGSTSCRASSPANRDLPRRAIRGTSRWRTTPCPRELRRWRPSGPRRPPVEVHAVEELAVRSRCRASPAPFALGGARSTPFFADSSFARLPATSMTIAWGLLPLRATMAAKKTTAMGPSTRPSRARGRKWSQQVTESSDALDLEPGAFKGSSRQVATSLKRSADRSRRRKSDSFRIRDVDAHLLHEPGWCPSEPRAATGTR